jgi:ATP-dependent Lhr-like helicase
MSFPRLSRNLQKKVWEMEWRRLTPIQEAAIPVILERNHALLMAGTAAGKTEAAFLPILSALESSGQIGDGLTGVKVLYLAPLRALINDQFERLERLLEGLGVPLVKWHGDVARSRKSAWLRRPRGVLQITPESLESLFVNQADRLAELFGALEYVVVDELHAFLDGDRGLQVRSLLYRMRRYLLREPVMIGLSATIGLPEAAQEFLCPQEPGAVKVVHPPEEKRQLFLQVEFFEKEQAGLAADLVRDVYELTKDKRTIVFCNSRGQVEELTHKLNRLGESLGGRLYEQRYFPHHSSIDKGEREWIEEQMKASRLPLTVVSTNTLELGVDIGALDLVVQVDATASVSSLRQRLGRSGRRAGADSHLMIYATEEESLVQAVAVTELLFAKWLEPPEIRQEAYDLLFHQVLAVCAERQGVEGAELADWTARHPLFARMKAGRVRELLQWMVEEDWLAVVEGKCVLGLQGEKLVRSREFYAVFQSPSLWKVMDGGRLVGTIEESPSVQAGETLLLGGGTWTITEVDEKRGIVWVRAALLEGKKPMWVSGTRNIHPQIAEMMYQVYTGDEDLDYLSPRAWQRLKEARMLAAGYGWARGVRVAFEGARAVTLYDFSGTKRQNAMATLLRGWLREQGVPMQVRQTALAISLEGAGVEKGFAERVLAALVEMLLRGQEEKYLLMGRGLAGERRGMPKYGAYLPMNFQRWIEEEIERDVQGLREWLPRVKWRVVR